MEGWMIAVLVVGGIIALVVNIAAAYGSRKNKDGIYDSNGKRII